MERDIIQEETLQAPALLTATKLKQTNMIGSNLLQASS